MVSDFSAEECKTLKQRLSLLRERKRITSADEQTINGIFNRPIFRNFLAETNFGQAHDCIHTIQTGEIGDALEAFERLRKLCMGVWLENCSSFAISNQGEMQIHCNDDGVTFTDDFLRHLESKEDGITSTYYRQAALRQIERYYVMKANGLLEDNFKPQRIADIGAGTLIASVMMRSHSPDAEIVAYEPGLVSSKSKSIAMKKHIDLRSGEFTANSDEKFDLIIMHFVLEHDVVHAQDLLRNALKMLAPGGKISISVPNYDAYHREYEAIQGLSGRDSETRLSTHDHLSGHQIIFAPNKLKKIIEEIEHEEGQTLPIQLQTILPRPLSFNQMLARSGDDRLLDTLERQGHPKDMDHQGSVLAISIGSTSRYRTPSAAYTLNDQSSAFANLQNRQAEAIETRQHRLGAREDRPR